MTFLITVNVILFMTGWFLQVLSYMIKSPEGMYENTMLPWFIMPAKLGTLAVRPWTVFTYMFMHVHLVPFLSNLLWLWGFGSILQGLTGNRKIVPLYLYGGLAGAAAFIAACYTLPSLRAGIDSAWIFGANSATMAIAIATTALAPDYRFFRMLNGGIPIWVLTLLYVIIDFAGIGAASAAYNIAHLAGALIGFLFIFSLRRGSDWSGWMNNFYDWVNNLFDPLKKETVRKRVKQKVFYKTGGQQPFVKRSNITQQRIDEILDKINQRGYHLLTEEEKNILKRAGETDL